MADEQSPTPRRKTAFVLAGGGSFGAVQVGMLQALTRAGVTADFVVGSSVGAINGAYYAAQPDERGVARLRELWTGLRRATVFPVTLRTVYGFMRRRDCLVSSAGLRRLIEDNLPNANLEDGRIPMHVVATDVLSGQAVVLSRGPAAEAILASAAIPAAFAPVSVGGRYLIDGAVASNTPVKIAVALGAKQLVVLPTGFSCSLQEPPQGAIASALHALTMLISGQLVSELESLPPQIAFAIAPTLCPLRGSPYDFSHAVALMDRSAAATESWLADGGMHKRLIPDQMRPHKH